MGYLTNRGYLDDLQELVGKLPEGWTMNTPCFISLEELEYFREISSTNMLFQHMIRTGRSINKALNGPEFIPCSSEITNEQSNAALDWAQALDDELAGLYHSHPLESGAYVHTMWARAEDRTEASQAVFAVDVCLFTSEVNKNRFYERVQELTRKQQQRVYKTCGSGQHGSSRNNGLTRSITKSSAGFWWSRDDKRWSRGVNHGYKPRGKSKADKRKGQIRDHIRPSRAVWVTPAN